MERIRYDFTKESSFNFSKGIWHYFIYLYRKATIYYHETRRGHGYVSTLVSSDSESEEEIYHDSSSVTSSWDSDVSVGDIFRSLLVNMVSASHLEDDREDTFELEELIQSDSDHELNT